MTTRFTELVRAELFLLRKRSSTWALLGIWATVSAFFVYVLPYLMYVSDGRTAEARQDPDFAAMTPERFVSTAIEGLPFYGGAIVLMLGVLSVGSEFGWGTWKTLYTQRPGRERIFAAKMTALAIIIVPFLTAVLGVGLGASIVIALIEDVPIAMPALGASLVAIPAGWLILATWTGVGVVLAVATRGTSLAIGIGILWALAFEGLVGNFAGGITGLGWLVDLLLRASGYSLVRAVPDAALTVSSQDGPGRFSGPFVSGEQAVLQLMLYLVAFLGISLWLIRRRDIV